MNFQEKCHVVRAMFADHPLFNSSEAVSVELA